MKILVSLLYAALIGLAANASFAADPMNMSAMEKAPLKPAKADTVNGQEVFTSRSCAACHGADGNSTIASNPKLA